MRFRILISAVVFAMLCAVAVASEPGFEITIPKTTSAPAIDGVLDDAIWQAAPTATVDNINTGGKVEAPYVATAMAAYDNSKLYVAFHNGEPNPGACTMTSPGHDVDVWRDDEIELFIEPALAGAQPYYPIMIHAANVMQDDESGGAGAGWEPNLESAVQMGTDCWTIELSVPFSDLGVAAGSPDGQTWGWNFNRHIVTDIDVWVGWATTGASFHTPERFGTLTFGEVLAAVHPSAKLTTCWGGIKQD